MEVARTLVVPKEANGTRLDVFLLRVAPRGTTRGAIQRAIREKRITVDEKQMTKPGSTIHTGQTIRFLPNAFAQEPSSPRPDANLPLPILHADPQLLVIDKPAGVAVHAGARTTQATIVDALLGRYPDLASVGEDECRPGIVHRLDKDTSGVMLVARTREMYTHLKEQFQRRTVKKQYSALVRGVVSEDEGAVKLPLIRSRRNPLRRTIASEGTGKAAETFFRVRERFLHYTLLDVFPHTGRMHQIRVHLAHLGFPVVGDPLYGKPMKDALLPPVRRQFLHAASISLELPSGKKKTFESPLPRELEEILAILREQKRRQAPKARPLSFRPWFPHNPNRR